MKFEDILPALREGKKVKAVLNSILCMDVVLKDGEVIDDSGAELFKTFYPEQVLNGYWEIISEPKTHEVYIKTIKHQAHNSLRFECVSAEYFSGHCTVLKDEEIVSVKRITITEGEYDG